MRFSIRAALFSLLLSTLLWLYISLQGEYEVVAPVRLEVTLDGKSSLESPLPQQVSVKLRGTGWNLVNALFLDRSLRIELRLSSESRSGILTYNDLQSGFRSSVPLQVVLIEPSRIEYRIGKLVQKKVPLRSNVDLTVADGWILARPLVLVPDSVLVIGSAIIIDTIRQWHTTHLVRGDVERTLVELVEVEQNPLVQVIPERVLVKADIQRIAEAIYYDIPVEVEGTLPQHARVVPTLVTVLLRGGIEDISRLQRERQVPVRVVVSAQDLQPGVALVRPIVYAPSWVQVSWYPQLIECQWIENWSAQLPGQR